MKSTEVEALQAKLAKSERNRQKLRDSLVSARQRFLHVWRGGRLRSHSGSVTQFRQAAARWLLSAIMGTCLPSLR